MNHLMHSAELESDAGGTRVTLVLHLRAKRGRPDLRPGDAVGLAVGARVELGE